MPSPSSIRDELIEIVQPWVTAVDSDGYLKSATKKPESIADAILERFDVTEKSDVKRSRIYGPFADTQTGYVIEQSPRGWRRVWVEPGEEDEEGPWLSTEADAFLDAATDWDACGSHAPVMLSTLRSMASKSEKKQRVTP